MAVTIQDIRATENPQKAYQFEFSVLGSTVSGNEDLLTQRVVNANIPAVENEQIEINYKSQKTFHVGRDSSAHTFTVTFWDDENHTVYNFFKNWASVGLNNSLTGGALTRDLYAAEGVTKLLNSDDETVGLEHHFTKLWPSGIGEISLDYSSSEHIQFDITFSYDRHYTQN